MWLGLLRGALGTALALLGVSICMVTFGWRWLVFPHTAWRLADYLRITIVPAGIAASTCFDAIMITRLIGTPWLRRAATVTLGFMAYTAASYRLNQAGNRLGTGGDPSTRAVANADELPSATRDYRC
jgi:hypothetical protein